jgi:GNAT superfamily N-acetyltransferase
MKLALINEADMPPRMDEQIRAAMCACFPHDRTIFNKTREWHDCPPEFCVVLSDADRVIAHAGVVNRTITVGGIPLRIAGVQSVLVLPEYRGQGLSDEVLHAAMAEAVRRGFDYGMLFCLPVLAKVYARCGWQELRDREIIRIEDGRELPLPDKNIAMYYRLHESTLPEGVIHLCGNDW